MIKGEEAQPGLGGSGSLPVPVEIPLRGEWAGAAGWFIWNPR
jgi:hypothetical protein